MNRIICVEGLSGAGKSTLCQSISLQLRQVQAAHRWHAEHDQDNPIRLPQDRAATIRETTRCWEALLKSGDEPHAGTVMDQSGSESGNRTMTDQPARPMTRLFDGRLLLLNVEFSLKCGMTPAQILEEMKPLVRLVNACGEFTLVYLDTRSTEKLFANTSTVRKAQDWYVQGLDGVSASLSLGSGGVERVHTYHHVVNEIMREVCDSLDCRKICVDVTDLDWPQAHAEVMDFLGLTGGRQEVQLDPARTSPPGTITAAGVITEADEGSGLSGVSQAAGRPDLTEYPGKYQDSKQHTYVIVLREGVLLAEIHPYLCYQPVEQVWTLVHLEKDIFVPRGQALMLRFRRDAAGRIQGLDEVGYLKEEAAYGGGTSSFFRTSG